MTARKLFPGPLVIASHNAGKVREIAALLGPFGIEPVSAGELRLDEPQHGISPGQAGVIYAGERVLGGGWIANAA